jgi:hypothetical protein
VGNENEVMRKRSGLPTPLNGNMEHDGYCIDKNYSGKTAHTAIRMVSMLKIICVKCTHVCRQKKYTPKC